MFTAEIRSTETCILTVQMKYISRNLRIKIQSILIGIGGMGGDDANSPEVQSVT